MKFPFGNECSACIQFICVHNFHFPFIFTFLANFLPRFSVALCFLTRFLSLSLLYTHLHSFSMHRIRLAFCSNETLTVRTISLSLASISIAGCTAIQLLALPYNVMNFICSIHSVNLSPPPFTLSPSYHIPLLPFLSSFSLFNPILSIANIYKMLFIKLVQTSITLSPIIDAVHYISCWYKSILGIMQCIAFDAFFLANNKAAVHLWNGHSSCQTLIFNRMTPEVILPPLFSKYPTKIE